MAKDDAAYVALMAKYKENRREMGEKALKYLDAAMKLRETGEVSDDAVLGGAYL